MWPPRKETWVLSIWSPLTAYPQIIQHVQTNCEFARALMTSSYLSPMEVNCYLWDECSFHHCLQEESHNQPKRSIEVNEQMLSVQICV